MSVRIVSPISGDCQEKSGAHFRRPIARAAAIEGQAVFNNPSFASKPFAEKLREIDRRMGVANKQATGSNVLSGGNLTRGNRANTIKLTPYQEKIAVKTKFAGPGKSSQEHLEAYKAQIAATRGA